MADFIKIMKATKRWDRNKWNSTDRKYTFYNGSTIEFLNADGDKAIGPRRDILYVNEANKISYEIYSQLEIRTAKDIYIDFNPTNKFWAHTEVLNEPDSELLVLTYRDNEGIPETVLASLLAKQEKAKTSEYWKNWCKVYIDGEIGSLEGNIFNNWRLIDNIPEDAKLIAYGMDFGFTNDPTTLVAVYKWNNQVILHELIYRKGLKNSEIVNILKQLNVKDVIFADSSEPKTIAEIKAYGFAMIGVKKGPNSVLEGIQLMQDYEYLVTKSSSNLINELENYIWLNKGNKTIPSDAFNHLIDAVRYVVWSRLGSKESNTKSQVFSFDF